MTTFKDVNLPNWLTIIRLVISPLTLPILLVYFLPANIFWINTGLAGLFVLFGLTDFFDGYLARRFDQETSLGKMLDPIADKFLVYSTLIALLAVKKIFFYWVIILIGREFFIMGLRSIALEHNLSIPVSLLGKLKTFFQMSLLTCIIMNPEQQKIGLLSCSVWNNTEFFLLVVTLALTVISAQQYYVAFIQAFATQQQYHEQIEAEVDQSDD